MSSAAERPQERRASLERSLQLALGLAVLALLISLTAAGAWIGRHAAEQFAASRLTHDADALIAGLAADRGQIDRPVAPVYSQPFSGHYFAVRFADGGLLRSRSLWDEVLAVEPLPPGATDLGVVPGPQDQQLLVWRAGYEKQGRRFTVAVAEDLNPLLRAHRRFVWIGAGVSVAGAFAVLLLQGWVLRRGFRRIDAVRAEVALLEAGEIERLSEAVPSEVKPLVRELNGLIAAWRAHLARSRKALGNLAHALKSPLNLILLHHPEPEDDPVAEQARRMQALIERELRRARLAGDRPAGTRFRPHEDLADLVAGIRTLHADKPLQIETSVEAPSQVPFDQEDMLELLGNLLDNAAKWTRGRVLVRVEAGRALRLCVEDDGPGVEPEAADRLAVRGGRLDESMPGHGLGLAIVGDIVSIHGGTLALDRSETLGGFRARVDLPG